jgi:hypothetical protein
MFVQTIPPSLITMTDSIISLRIPVDLVDDTPLARASSFPIALELLAETPQEAERYSDVFMIQRLITVRQRWTQVTVLWSEAALNRIEQQVGSVPGLALCMLWEEAEHRDLGSGHKLRADRRAKLVGIVRDHQMRPSWFTAPDSSIAGDYAGVSTPPDLYDRGQLKGVDEFGKFITQLLQTQLTAEASRAARWKESLTAVVYELVENTHVHGRLSYDRETLVREGVRGLVFRRILTSTGGPLAVASKAAPTLDCLELCVFDSGIGFWGAKYKEALAHDSPLRQEWENVSVCLSTHAEDNLPEIAGARQHRQMGLYEVLRALKFLGGAIQVRAGRIFGFRSFMPGDLSLQLEAPDSDRPGMPKAKLLDFTQPYRPGATAMTPVSGVAVKVIVPLG